MPKPGDPNYKGPVHEAVRSAQETWDRTGGAVVKSGQDAIGGLEQGARAGVEGVASGLRGVGDDLFGSDTMIGGALGGLFGGGPKEPMAARPVTAPSSQSTVSTPAATARPLVMSAPAATMAPAPKTNAGKKQSGGKANRRKKSK